MKINSVSFNNINSLVTCATDSGYYIYSINPTLEKRKYCDIGGLSFMKIYNTSNIIVLVGGGANPYKSKDRLFLRDQKFDKNLISIDVSEQIKNILLCKEKIVVAVTKKVYLFDWDGEMQHFVETFCNENGLCVLNEETSTIATLGSTKGQICLWNYITGTKQTIDAHITNVEVIAISSDGRYIATASETGTLIRVFDIENPHKPKYEFRRGSQTANIYAISFSPKNDFLACSSSNGTLHVFDICDSEGATRNSQSYLVGMKNFLPTWFGSQWSFKQYNLNNSSKSICCFDEQNNVYVVNVDGYYYKTPNIGGKFGDLQTMKLEEC